MDNFDDLPYEEKVFTLVKNGAFINSINYYNQKVDLYHMNGIFVEVFYHPVSSTIHEIATAEPNRLHLYSPVDINNQ